MKRSFTLFSGILLSFNFGFSQNAGVNADGTLPETGVMLDVKGANAKTASALQNVFQIKSADASTDALKLRIGMQTHATVGLRYGVIEVPEYAGSVITAYRHLALQPLGGFVGVGISSPATTFHTASKSLPNAHYITLADAVVQGQEGRFQLIGEEQSWASATLILSDIFNGTDNRHWVMMHRTSTAAPYTNPGNSLLFAYRTTTATGQDISPAASTDVKMTITPTGNIGMGTTDPSVNLEVSGNDMQTAINIVNTTSTAIRNPRLNILNYGPFGTSVIQFHNARGTSAAPTASLIGDGFGNIDFDGYTGAGFADGVHIETGATENWSATNQGSYLAITTKATGTNGIVERFRIAGNGYVGIGTAAPEVTLHVANESTTTPRGIMSQQSSTDGNSAFLILRKSRGTITAPTAIIAGDNIGAIYSEAYDGAAFLRTGAMMKFSPSGAIGVGSIPTDIVFNTGSSGLGTERLRITATGIFQIPLASLPVYANNAAAVAALLPVGSLYRTGLDPDVICVVH